MTTHMLNEIREIPEATARLLANGGSALQAAGQAIRAGDPRFLVTVARGSSDPAAQRWLASLANNMGWARHDAGAYDEALALFTLALAERKRQDDPARIRIARWCVARCLRSLGRTEEALAEQRALAAELDAVGETDEHVTAEIGECLRELGRT